MSVGQMTVIRYESRFGPWHSDDVLDPTWEQIEAAVGRLDRCLFPFVWLYKTPVEATGDDTPQFEVTGGDGAYVVLLRPDDDERRGLVLQNPSGGDDEVDVWVSDQGASFAGHDVCTSMDEVLRVTRYFFEHGGAAPHTRWK